MFEQMIEKMSDLIWTKLEPRIIKACEEGYTRGRVYGYSEGHDDGAVSATDDVIRRMTYVYDFIRHKAEEDAYTQAGAINIEEISKNEFDAIIDDMGEV